MNSRDLARAVVSAADAFLARRLWRRFADEDLVAFDLPGQELLIGSIMGAAGEEFGLFLLQGPRAFADFEQMIVGEDDGPFEWSSKVISVTRERSDEMEPAFTRILHLAGRTGGMAPMLLVKEEHRTSRPPRQHEIETILIVLRGLLAADDQGRLEPSTWTDPRVMPVLRITGDARAPGVKVERTRIAEGAERELPPIAATAGFEGLPRLDTVYCADLHVLPMPIRDEEYDVPMLTILDADLDQIRMSEAIPDADAEAAAHRLFACLRGEARDAVPGLPRQIVFANEALCRAATDHLTAFGVECTFAEHVPLLERTIAKLAGYLVRPTGTPRRRPDALPEPGDLDAWKDADRWAKDVLIDAAGHDALQAPRPWQRYFGRPGDLDTLRADPRQVMLFAGYCQWFLFDFRGGKRSRTAAERALERELPPALRTLIEAMIAARPALYRVEDVAAGDSLTLVDVSSGRSVRIADRTLSTSTIAGMVFFAHVYPAGSFHFATVTSPVLYATEVEPALALLAREHGFTPGDTVPAAASHLVGRLWDWTARRDGDANLRLVDHQPEDEDEVDAASPAAMQKELERYYFGWLDERIPALGNKTPRQMCRTQEGRRKVAHLIWTIRDPIGTPGLRVPRDEMLRRLGLTAGAGEAGKAGEEQG
jgi:hypothetical protein